MALIRLKKQCNGFQRWKEIDSKYKGLTMKRIHLILIVMYVFVTLYFAIFNWDMFLVNLNISLGLGIIRIPLLIILSIAGLLLILTNWLIFKIYSLKVDRSLMRKDAEIANFKATQYDNQLSEMQSNSNSLKELHEKIDSVMEILAVEKSNQHENVHVPAG